MRFLVSATLLVCCLASSEAARASTPTVEQVRAGTEAVHADPALPGLKAERRLRWKPADEESKPREEAPAWLAGLVQWISEAGRWLVWLLGAIALVLVGLRLRAWLALRGESGTRPVRLPTHVRDLDIRPESLPDDIGAAARELWARGEARAALSLLYRGALSRLVHGHGVPVRAASTEGECVQLAARHAPPATGAFFAQLVGLWQAAVYGALAPDAERVLALCAEFDARLPRRTAPTPP